MQTTKKTKCDVQKTCSLILKNILKIGYVSKFFYWKHGIMYEVLNVNSAKKTKTLETKLRYVVLETSECFRHRDMAAFNAAAPWVLQRRRLENRSGNVDGKIGVRRAAVEGKRVLRGRVGRRTTAVRRGRRDRFFRVRRAVLEEQLGHRESHRGARRERGRVPVRGAAQVQRSHTRRVGQPELHVHHTRGSGYALFRLLYDIFHGGNQQLTVV